MITTFILGLSLLILLCFAIDIAAAKIKIPSVILLMGVGIALHYSLNALHIAKAVQILPFLGTMALILIVIEAGFDLDYDPAKKKVILKAFASATLNLVVCLGVITALLKLFYKVDLLQCLIQAIPFSIVSSAIAIPSSRPLDAESKEFVTYETVFSDVLGIILFNLFITTDAVTSGMAVSLAGSLVVSIIVSVLMSFALVALIRHSKHKILFVPIFCGLILVYAIGKYLHLPLLIAMMIFGLVMNNLEDIKIPKFPITVDRKMKARINYFKRLTHELTFVLRGLFFVVFGYYLNLGQFLNPVLWLAVAGLVAFVFALRIGVLKTVKAEISQGVWYVAPRGLISILLAMSIPETKQIPGFNHSLLDLFIIITILIQLMARGHAQQQDSAEIKV